MFYQIIYNTSTFFFLLISTSIDKNLRIWLVRHLSTKNTFYLTKSIIEWNYQTPKLNWLVIIASRFLVRFYINTVQTVPKAVIISKNSTQNEALVSTFRRRVLIRNGKTSPAYQQNCLVNRTVLFIYFFGIYFWFSILSIQNLRIQIASSQPIFLDSIKSGAKSFDAFVREKVSPLLGLKRPEFEDQTVRIPTTTTPM